MYKKVIKYVDYEGVEREETHYFHLSPAEMIDLQASYPGGMKGYLEEAMSRQDGPVMMDLFKKLVRLSYGRKSPDGRRFMKSDEIWTDFAETEAYVALFMELVTDESAANTFAAAVLPDMSKYAPSK